MADYVLTRIADNIGDKSLLAYDAVNDIIYDSGVKNPSITEIESSSLDVGLQAMESSGEQVLFTNQNSLVSYAPPWHVVDDINPGGSYDRFYDEAQIEVRFADRSTVVTNPVMQVNIPTDTLALSFNFTWPEAQPGVVFEFLSNNGKPPIWRAVKDVSQGVHDEILYTPLAYKAGNYTFRIYRLDGQPLRVMGDPVTGNAGYSVKTRHWTDKKLATQEYVQQEIASGGTGLDTVMLKATYDTNNDGIVDKAKAVSGVESLTGSNYYGTNAQGAAGFYPLPDASQVSAQVGQNTTDITHLKTATTNNAQQVAANLRSINANTADINVLKVKVAGNTGEISGIQSGKADGLTASANKANHTITISLTAKGRVIDTDVVDLSTWFTSTPVVPGDTHKVYYGFTTKTAATMLEADIVAGTSRDAPSISGLDINATRADATPSRIWIWLPDVAGTVQGFNFSGFLSVWTATQLTVATVPGKLYMSPNLTAATDVSFEVIV